MNPLFRWQLNIEMAGSQLKIDILMNFPHDSARLPTCASKGAGTTSLPQLLAKLPKSKPISDEVAEIRYMIEELRVSLFEQQLRTKYQVSDKRILVIIDTQ